MGGLSINFKTRLAKLEACAVPNAKPRAILRTIICAKNGQIVERPLLGWSFGLGDKRAFVTRASGESVEELEARAIQAAHEHLSSDVVRLLSIVDKADGGRHE